MDRSLISPGTRGTHLVKLPWTKATPLQEGETITLIVRKGRLEPTWWDGIEPGANDFERGYDAGFLDGIQLRCRAEREGKVPA